MLNIKCLILLAVNGMFIYLAWNATEELGLPPRKEQVFLLQQLQGNCERATQSMQKILDDGEIGDGLDSILFSIKAYETGLDHWLFMPPCSLEAEGEKLQKSKTQFRVKSHELLSYFDTEGHENEIGVFKQTLDKSSIWKLPADIEKKEELWIAEGRKVKTQRAIESVLIISTWFLSAVYVLITAVAGRERRGTTTD